MCASREVYCGRTHACKRRGLTNFKFTSITIATTPRPCFRGATEYNYRIYGLYDMASLQARDAHGNHIFDYTLKRFKMTKKEADHLRRW